MKIGVIGAGGVGGYFGGRLAEHGHEVIFIARGKHLKAIQESGLHIRSPLGNFSHFPARAIASPEEAGIMDAVLVCVKAWQVPEAAGTLRPMVGPETMVLPLQNGVDACGQLAEVLGAGPVLGGTCRIIAKISEPGVIEHIGIEPHISLGELEGPPGTRTEKLAGALRSSGIHVTVSDDILSVMWQKFVFIAAISGVGALTRVPFGLVRQNPESRKMYLQAVAEIIAIAEARGVNLPAGYAAALDRNLDTLPAEGTASMQRDIIAGVPSELEAQNGAVVRLAAEIGLDAPINRFIYHALLPQERKARGA